MVRTGLCLALAALILGGCSRTPTVAPVEKADAEKVGAPPGPPTVVGGEISLPRVGLAGAAMRLGTGIAQRSTVEPQPPDEERQMAHDLALQQGWALLAEKKWQEALAAFEAADQAMTTSVSRLGIERIRRRIDQDAAAARTLADIQAVLDDGRVEEAARLAGDALQQYGSVDDAEPFVKLKRQADALLALQIDDKKAQFERFRKEYETADKEGNKRAALLALEQALLHGGDAQLRAKYEALARDVARYDELRERAAELRQDPQRLEEGLAALQDAAKAWETLAVRQEIDEYALALQHRKERISVADFEVRGDVGAAGAGAFLADELLPAFKTRFDVVDRGELADLTRELDLANGLLDDEPARRELHRVAKVRYLVVGSITAVNGLTVHARLVDNETGLVVQTARVAARTLEELVERMPLLATELMMTDEQKAAAEAKQAAEATPVEVLKPAAGDELPPLPEEPAPNAALIAPLIPQRPQAPPWADLQPARFDRLPPAPPPGQVIPLPVLPPARDLEFRQRSMWVALELGDNLFRRGLYREAFVHYEFALNLFPGHRDIRFRIQRCRPLLSPVILPPPVVIRPRVAVLDFLVVGDPRAVPPHLGHWTPEFLAPYLEPEFRVVSRAELFWWMGRLGITPADLLNDPVARLYLGRALNVRYFLFGHLVQVASFDVTTYLVDAEYGFLASSARIRVRGGRELKLRLAELAWLLKASPDQRRLIENEDAQWVLLLNDLRRAEREAQWQVVIELGRRGFKLRPNSVEIAVMISTAERRLRTLSIEQARAQEEARRIAMIQEQQRLRLELAREAELARLRAEQLAAARASAEQQRLLAQRQAAAQDFIRRGQLMVQASNFTLAIQLFESAVALRPNDDAIYRELALARAKAAETARANAAEAAARREAELRQQREAELARTRAQLDAERRKRQADELARRKVIEERDHREHQRLMDLAQQLAARQQYDQAVAAAQKAKQLRATPEAERLVSQLLADLARTDAERRGAEAKAELDRQLAAEREARLRAEAEAEKNRQLYETLLAEGRQLLQAEKFAEAEQALLKARDIQQTSAVAVSLKQAQAGKTRVEARLRAEREKSAAQQRDSALLTSRLTEAQAALDARETEKALRLYQEAKRLAPTNVDVLAGLAKAQQLHDLEVAKARREEESKSRRDAFQRLLASGRQHLDAGRFDSAVISLGEAVKLMPDDADARALLAQAESKVSADAQAKAELKKKAVKYENHLRDGRRYLAARQYDRALQEFKQALVETPGDPAATEFANEALKRKTEADKTLAAEIEAKRAAARKAVDLNNALNQFRSALAAGKLDEAEKAYDSAARLDAENPEVVNARKSLQAAKDAAQTARSEAGKRDEQFNSAVLKARAALQAGKLDEAAAALAEALKLKPTDASARALQNQLIRARSDAARMERDDKIKQLIAQARAALGDKKFDEAGKLLDQAEALAPRDSAIAAARNDLKKTQTEMAAGDETRKRQLAFATAMTQARTLLQTKKFDEAEKAVAEALKLSPQDRTAQALKAQIDAARKAADAAMNAEQKTQEAARLLAQARSALQAKRLDDAARFVAEALKIAPQDRTALALQKQIEDERKEAAAMLVKRQQYQRLMQQGRLALQQKKPAEAVKAFEAALEQMPGDAEATRLLQEAKKAAAPAPPPTPPAPPMPPRPAEKPPAYTRQMEQGAAQEKAKRHDLALVAYRAALRFVPNDPDAKKKVDFCQFMVEGDRAMKGRKFPEAVAAFENAAKLFPNDAAAKAALQQAKAAK